MLGDLHRDAAARAGDLAAEMARAHLEAEALRRRIRHAQLRIRMAMACVGAARLGSEMALAWAEGDLREALAICGEVIGGRASG